MSLPPLTATDGTRDMARTDAFSAGAVLIALVSPSLRLLATLLSRHLVRCSPAPVPLEGGFHAPLVDCAAAHWPAGPDARARQRAGRRCYAGRSDCQLPHPARNRPRRRSVAGWPVRVRAAGGRFAGGLYRCSGWPADAAPRLALLARHARRGRDGDGSVARWDAALPRQRRGARSKWHDAHPRVCRRSIERRAVVPGRCVGQRGRWRDSRVGRQRRWHATAGQRLQERRPRHFPRSVSDQRPARHRIARRVVRPRNSAGVDADALRPRAGRRGGRARGVAVVRLRRGGPV